MCLAKQSRNIPGPIIDDDMSTCKETLVLDRTFISTPMTFKFDKSSHDGYDRKHWNFELNTECV